MGKIDITPVSEPKEYPLTYEEFEALDRRFISYDEILDDEEARVFDELSKKHYEDAVKYEQEHKP